MEESRRSTNNLVDLSNFKLESKTTPRFLAWGLIFNDSSSRSDSLQPPLHDFKMQLLHLHTGVNRPIFMCNCSWNFFSHASLVSVGQSTTLVQPEISQHTLEWSPEMLYRWHVPYDAHTVFHMNNMYICIYNWHWPLMINSGSIVERIYFQVDCDL